MLDYLSDIKFFFVSIHQNSLELMIRNSKKKNLENIRSQKN